MPSNFFHLLPTPAPQSAAIYAAYQRLDQSQWLNPAQIQANQLAALDG
jgi:hypothetical protein